MRVLLINANRKTDLLAAAPLGLCYVASATEKAGHDVRVLDLCFTGRRARRALHEAIAAFSPQAIGLSVRNIDNANMLHPISYLPELLGIVGHIRGVTQVPLILGGSGATLCPEGMLYLLKADFVVVSDGEESFVRLLDALERGEDPGAIPGVGFARGDQFHLTPTRRISFQTGNPDLGRWIDLDPYWRVGSSYNVQSKRGCAHQCTYCTYGQTLEGNALRLRAPVDVVDEIEEALSKHDPPMFEFVDSVFNEPIDHCVEILEEILRRPWKANFTTMGTSPRGLDEHYLDLLWRAGFRSFMITPESASDTMLENYRKGFARQEVVAAAQQISKTRFAAWWFFMIGGPGETNETLQESIDFVLQLLAANGGTAAHVAHFFVGVRMYPGTQLWELGREEGFIPPEADPLQPLWYLSEGLDLVRAIEQLTEAASRCPLIYLGSDERVLGLSGWLVPVLRFLRLPGPYWQHFPLGDRVGLKRAIRFRMRPQDMARKLRSSLTLQGYGGPRPGPSGRQPPP